MFCGQEMFDRWPKSDHLCDGIDRVKVIRWNLHTFNWSEVSSMQRERTPAVRTVVQVIVPGDKRLDLQATWAFLFEWYEMYRAATNYDRLPYQRIVRFYTIPAPRREAKWAPVWMQMQHAARPVCGPGSPVCAIVLIATNGLAGASLVEKGNERYQQELREFMKWPIR
ncbi:hypothetical protein WK54_34405 [Burkholderia ubonensis]|nr:hypothetical protein WK54_34405 [Burkholderia ubonensis]